MVLRYTCRSPLRPDRPSLLIPPPPLSPTPLVRNSHRVSQPAKSLTLYSRKSHFAWLHSAAIRPRGIGDGEETKRIPGPGKSEGTGYMLRSESVQRTYIPTRRRQNNCPCVSVTLQTGTDCIVHTCTHGAVDQFGRGFAPSVNRTAVVIWRLGIRDHPTATQPTQPKRADGKANQIRVCQVPRLASLSAVAHAKL